MNWPTFKIQSWCKYFSGQIFQIFKFPCEFSIFPGEKKNETTIENCPKSTIANYK